MSCNHFRQLQMPLILILVMMMAACHNDSGNSSNRSDSQNGATNTGVRPENALSTFELEPGFKIELLASEPLISDPVDMEIDEYGRLYVVECMDTL